MVQARPIKEMAKLALKHTPSFIQSVNLSNQLIPACKTILAPESRTGTWHEVSKVLSVFLKEEALFFGIPA